jgi:hypothetical protein
VDLRANGTLVLSDIYKGRNMEGVRRGEIKKPVLGRFCRYRSTTGGPEQISFLGTFTLERILGTVPSRPMARVLRSAGAAQLPVRGFDDKDPSVKRCRAG